MVRLKLDCEKICLLLEGFFENSDDALILVDANSNIILFNESAENVFEIPRDRVIGTEIYGFQYKFISSEAKQTLSFEMFRNSSHEYFLSILNGDNNKNIDLTLHYGNNRSKKVFVKNNVLELEGIKYLMLHVREDFSNSMLRDQLHFRVDFESLVSKTSTYFLKIEHENIRNEIKNSLGELARFMVSEAVVLYTFTEEESVPAYWWIQENVSHRNRHHDKFYKNIHKWIISFAEAGELVDENLFFMDETSKQSVRNKLKLMGLNSLIVMPVEVGNKVVGAIAVVNSKQEVRRRREDLKLLSTYAEIMISAIERQSQQKKLIDEMQLNTALADISNFLLNEQNISEISRYIFKKALELSKATCGMVVYFDEFSQKAVVSSYSINSNSKRIVYDVEESDVDLSHIFNNLLDKSVAYFNNNPNPNLNTIVFMGNSVVVDNYISSPAQKDDKNLAFLFLANKIGGFDNEDLSIASKLSSHIAIGIEKARTTKKLLESESRYRNLVENANDGIYLLYDKFYAYVNPSFCSITGFSYEELTAPEFNYNVMLTQNSKQVIEERYKKRFVGEKLTNNYQIEILTKSGELKYVDVTTVELKVPGVNVAVLGIMRDVSSRIKYQALIERHESMLEAISYSAEKLLKRSNWRDYIEEILEKLRLITDSTAVFLYRNLPEENRQRTVCEFFSFADKNNLDKTGDYLTSFNFREIGLSTWEDKLENREILLIKSSNLSKEESNLIDSSSFKTLTLVPIFVELQYWGFILIQDNKKESDWSDRELEALTTASEIFGAAFMREDNERQLASINSQLEQRVKQRTAELENALFDLNNEVTRRKNIEDELIRAKNNITEAYMKEKELGELKSRFIAMVSHEYRTPLTVVLSSAFLLERSITRNDQSAASKHLDKIRIAVKQMTHLLENVLMSGKIEDSTFELNYKPLDLATLLETIIDEIKIVDKYSHPINYSINLISNLVMADQTILNLILNNLLTNAAKYSPFGAAIDVSIYSEDNTLVLKIKDYGYGISEKDQKNIFAAFYRGENNSSAGGTGLGLSLVKRGVEMMKGEIDFITEIGVGTEFIIKLPVQFVNPSD